MLESYCWQSAPSIENFFPQAQSIQVQVRKQVGGPFLKKVNIPATKLQQWLFSTKSNNLLVLNFYFCFKMSFADSSTVFLLSVTGQIASGTFLPEMDDLVRTKIKLTIDPLKYSTFVWYFTQFLHRPHSSLYYFQLFLEK